jgi:hypothetical protein
MVSTTLAPPRGGLAIAPDVLRSTTSPSKINRGATTRRVPVQLAAPHIADSKLRSRQA